MEGTFDLTGVQFGSNPEMKVYVLDERDYKEPSYISDLKKANRAITNNIGVTSIKALRGLWNLFSNKEDKIPYDNFIKNTKFDGRRDKLYKFFSDMTVDQAQRTDFLKIFEVKRDDERNFKQILGDKAAKSDPTYKLSDNQEDISANMLTCLEELSEHDFMDFRVFIEIFGRVPYAYFVRGMEEIMSYGEYKNYSDLFTDVMKMDLEDFLAKL